MRIVFPKFPPRNSPEFDGGIIMAKINDWNGPGIFDDLDRSISTQLYTTTHAQKYNAGLKI
jgi:hypothetical protein